MVVTTPTRRQRRYVFLKRMSYERCQQVPRQSERAPIIISDFREEIQIDTTEKSLTQCAADQVSCFDFLSQVDRMTVVVPVHNKMSVPVSSLYQKHTNYLSAMPVAGHRCVSDSSTTQFHLSLSITPLFFHISLWIRLSQVYHSFRLKIPKKQTGERKRNPVVMFLHGKGAAKQKYWRCWYRNNSRLVIKRPKAHAHTQRPIRLDPVFLLFFSDVLKGRKRRRGNVGPATLIRFDPLATIFYDRRDLGKGGKVKAYRSTTTSSTSSREEKKDNPVCMRSEESGRAAGCVSEERRRNGEREPSQECVCFRYSQHNHVRGGGMGWKGGVEGGSFYWSTASAALLDSADVRYFTSTSPYTLCRAFKVPITRLG